MRILLCFFLISSFLILNKLIQLIINYILFYRQEDLEDITEEYEIPIEEIIYGMSDYYAEKLTIGLICFSFCLNFLLK
ncbi:MAG: hypothetical protein HUJ68_10390 [Clostridia bacterium]|nr:hypothetical protein [Clostridia bacterium]